MPIDVAIRKTTEPLYHLVFPFTVEFRGLARCESREEAERVAKKLTEMID